MRKEVREDKESTESWIVSGLFDEEEVDGEVRLAAERCFCGWKDVVEGGNEFVNAIV